MKAYKIDVRNLTEQQKKDVQDAFFSLGYKWSLFDTNHGHLDKEFYYADAHGSLWYGRTEHYFYKDSDVSLHNIITYTELMQLGKGKTMFTKADFTKSSLKDGMFIRLRNEKIFILTQGNLLNGSGWMPLESYNVDLKHPDDSWSIMEAMELKQNSKKLSYGFSKIEQFEYNSIWQRPEQTEQQKQLSDLKAAQEELLLKAKEIGDKIVALQQCS